MRSAKHFFAVADQNVTVALLREIGHAIHIVVLNLRFLDSHVSPQCCVDESADLEICEDRQVIHEVPGSADARMEAEATSPHVRHAKLYHASSGLSRSRPMDALPIAAVRASRPT